MRVLGNNDNVSIVASFTSFIVDFNNIIFNICRNQKAFQNIVDIPKQD